MFPFRNRNSTYQIVPVLSSEDVDRSDVHQEQSNLSRGILLEKSQRKQPKSLLLLFLILVSVASFNYLNDLGTPSWTPFEREETSNQVDAMPGEEEENSPYDDKIACKIPKLDPFEHSIRHLVEKPEHVDCTKAYPLLFRSTLNSTLVTLMNVKDVNPNVSSCCYQTVVKGGELMDPDNNYRLSKRCTPLSLDNGSELIIPPKDEFIGITCKILQSSLDESNSTTTESVGVTHFKTMDMHAFVPKKPAVENRIEKYYANLFMSRKSGKERFGIKPSALLEKDRVNVVILGIDAVSRMNFIRAMPKTHSFLMKELEAVEMRGFNKIGDNTRPNLAPALTSLNQTALKSTCEKDHAFDRCPFIWKQYAKNGYRTAYGEDSTWMGIFNYLRKGFKLPPTDYYLRPFGVVAESLIGAFQFGNAKLCYGPRLSFEVLLDYMRKFAFAMGVDKRYFQFIWATSLTHDELNHGRLGDEQLRSTLKWFQERGYFDRTVFILMSDHGIRWGPIHEYLQGQLEARLPFMYFVIPSWFQEKYEKAYENLMLNQDRLTTTYDLHETLLDLLDLSGLERETISSREQALESADKDGKAPLGISHFLPVPLSRTCEMAGIPEHYCACHQLKELNTSQPDVKQAANYIVYEINMIVSHYPECGFLSLENIKTANMIDFGFNTTEVEKGKGYQLTVVTSPGKAVFQASVMRNQTGTWRVSGSISRTNMYRNQSHCVNDDDILKLYCYCIDCGVFLAVSTPTQQF